MALEINFETNPIDNIVDGDVFVVQEGQLAMRSPITIWDGGELHIENNATLILD